MQLSGLSANADGASCVCDLHAKLKLLALASYLHFRLYHSSPVSLCSRTTFTQTIKIHKTGPSIQKAECQSQDQAGSSR